MTPSASTSSMTRCEVRIACRTTIAGASEGPACTVFITQIAISWQSGQSWLFGSDGQHGMSAGIASGDIADMSPIAIDAGMAAAGVTTGPIARPKVTQIAKTRLMSRRSAIPHHPTNAAAGEDPTI